MMKGSMAVLALAALAGAASGAGATGRIGAPVPPGPPPLVTETSAAYSLYMSGVTYVPTNDPIGFLFDVDSLSPISRTGVVADASATMRALGNPLRPDGIASEFEFAVTPRGGFFGMSGVSYGYIVPGAAPYALSGLLSVGGLMQSADRPFRTQRSDVRLSINGSSAYAAGVGLDDRGFFSYFGTLSDGRFTSYTLNRSDAFALLLTSHSFTLQPGDTVGLGISTIIGSGTGFPPDLRTASLSGRLGAGLTFNQIIPPPPPPPPPPPALVPEPSTWATMIAGFGLIGGAVRRRRRAAWG